VTEARKPDREADYVQHIIDAGQAILAYAKGGKRAFLDNKMAQDAIIRQFMVMGEAARRVSEETRAAFPQVPWRSIMTFRNRLVHGYDEVEVERVWEIIGTALKHALPELRRLKEEL
jgi:uncharacterized protein with HEPN domain